VIHPAILSYAEQQYSTNLYHAYQPLEHPLYFELFWPTNRHVGVRGAAPGFIIELRKRLHFHFAVAASFHAELLLTYNNVARKLSWHTFFCGMVTLLLARISSVNNPSNIILINEIIKNLQHTRQHTK
jgi:hypothetical protein